LAKKFTVLLNTDTCKACGICVALCPKQVLGQRHDGKAEVVNQEACIGCQNCSVHCPDFCFVVKEVAAND
jgi:2-oxoglutarate ferredoxin oxidoreductase subunit delta